MRRSTLAMLGLSLVATWAGAGEPARTLNGLRAFYAANCVKCHGPDGSGHSADGRRLKGMDFTDAARMAGESDDMMAKTIRKGIFFGVVMHPYKTRLSHAETLTLVREVLRKAEKGKVIKPEAEAPR